jgi:hypothetical protein
MITPLLFPYTYLSDTQRERILATFGSLAMFGTREGLEHPDPRIKTIIPVSGDENRLISFLKEYSQFTTSNMDRISSFLKGRGGTPLVEPDGVPAIRSEILKGMAHDTVENSDLSVDSREHLFRARVLLEIARDYDEKLHEIDQEMENIAIREKMLLEQLQGGDEPDLLFDIHQPDPPDLSADMSIEHRISAWADLFIHAWPESGLEGDGLFLTTSRMVMDILTERIPELVKVDCAETLPGDQKELAMVLRELSNCECAEKDSGLMSDLHSKLSVYVAYNVSPALFFSRLSGTGLANIHEKGGVRNTVVCFFLHGLIM